jgi:uncharacterized protein (TIGR02271 family)
MSPVPDNPTVVTSDGLTGVIESEASSPAGSPRDLQVLVTLSDGRRIWVPAEALILQADGQYQLQVPIAELEPASDRPTVHSRSRELDERLAELGLDFTRPAAPLASDTTSAGPTDDDAHPAPAPRPEHSEPAQAAASAVEEAPPAATQPTVRLTRVVQSHKEDVEADLLKETVDVHRVPVNEFVDTPPEIRHEGDSIIIPVLEEVLVVTKRLLLKEEVVVTRRRASVTEQTAEVRRTEDVFVAPLPADGESSYNAEAAEREYQAHYAAYLASSGYSFEYFTPAYTYGRALQTNSTADHHQAAWEQLEPEARRTWEAHNPGTWDLVREAVRAAWAR